MPLCFSRARDPLAFIGILLFVRMCHRIQGNISSFLPLLPEHFLWNNPLVHYKNL